MKSMAPLSGYLSSAWLCGVLSRAECVCLHCSTQGMQVLVLIVSKGTLDVRAQTYCNHLICMTQIASPRVKICGALITDKYHSIGACSCHI